MQPFTKHNLHQLDSEDGLALTVDADGNAKISARDPAVAPDKQYSCWLRINILMIKIIGETLNRLYVN